MKRHTAKWVLKAEDDIESARTLAALAKPKRDVVCFHCQQAAEKYLKALLQAMDPLEQNRCLVGVAPLERT